MRTRLPFAMPAMSVPSFAAYGTADTACSSAPSVACSQARKGAKVSSRLVLRLIRASRAGAPAMSPALQRRRLPRRSADSPIFEYLEEKRQRSRQPLQARVEP